MLDRREQHLIASFFADPRYRAVRPLLEKLVPGSTKAIDALVRRVRVEQWRDLSSPD
jgi:hypothetical protein